VEIATGVEAVLAGDIADGSLPRANSSTLREITAPPIWIGDGRRWFSCTVRHFGGPLWVTHAAEGIRSEMSGSPIVTEIGVVCTATAPWAGGPNPRLTQNLPGWLLRMPFMEARA
jgi:hypothetical protein